MMKYESIVKTEIENCCTVSCTLLEIELSNRKTYFAFMFKNQFHMGQDWFQIDFQFFSQEGGCEHIIMMDRFIQITN